MTLHLGNIFVGNVNVISQWVNVNEAVKCTSIVVEYIRVLLKGQTGHLSVTATVNRYSHRHTEHLPQKPSVSVPVLLLLLLLLLS